jgi:hypothetical protein
LACFSVVAASTIEPSSNIQQEFKTGLSAGFLLPFSSRDLFTYLRQLATSRPMPGQL